MTDQPIPGMATHGLNVTQWRAETLQVINWGGFAGHHSVPLDTVNNLFTGPSGSGKSTLLDAYLALMMDSRTPLNGASNDNATGRARSAEQRSTLSYARGQIGTTRDDYGARPKVLRGDGGNTWSAIAMTWTRGDGEKFTALRLYWVPAAASKQTDVKMHLATIPGEFNLAAVEPHAVHQFHHTRMNAAFPGLNFADSYLKFAAGLFKRLDIGANGDGASALKLLARIQGGRQVASVDGLYKTLVLEEPKTYEAADTAIAHFRELEGSYEQMRNAEEQVATLKVIATAHPALREAEQEAFLIDTFRVSETEPDAATPLNLWRYRTERDLLDTEVDTIIAEKEEQDGIKRSAGREALSLEAQIAENLAQQRDNGGDALQQAETDLKTFTEARDETQRARGRFEQQTLLLGPTPATREDFTALHVAAGQFLAGYAAAEEDLADRIKAAHLHAAPYLTEQDTLLKEKTWLLGRGDLIPQNLHEARVLIAERVGLDPADLPFVGELIDLAPEHNQWREAAELLLGGFARTMLVPRTQGRGFRTRLNALRLKPRINFTLAAIGAPTRTLDETLLPGRLIFRDSPFTGWLQAELGRRFDYACVPDPTAFADDTRRRITLTGQTQDGDRGAHGGHGQRPILGFSNERAIAEINERLGELANILGDAARAEQRLTAERQQLGNIRAAHQVVRNTAWDTIDVAAATARVEAKTAERDALLANSDILRTLQKTEQNLRERRDKAVRAKNAAEDRIEVLNGQHGALATRQDTVGELLADLDDNPHVSLADDQASRLVAEYEKFSTTGAHADFEKVFDHIRRGLAEQVRKAREDIKTQTTMLTNAFEAFQRNWPNRNLGTGVESYPDYRAILDDLIAEGLPQRRKTFTAKVVDWSGEDLLSLHSAFREALEEISDRLVPVNEILHGLAFGPGRDRLCITLRSLGGREQDRFRRELKILASHTTADLSPDDIEARFEELRTFIKRIRTVDDGGTSGDRDSLLDVRRHIHIEAECLDKDTGEQISIYDSLGNKSGGETQELIAFIVGAALRYQLGNATQAVPAYAPVFLDEGFVKADAEFAGRAVNAWRGLGFQLIIAAPLDKYTAIEPYMDQTFNVVKTADGHTRLQRVVGLTPARPVPRMS